MTWEKKDKNLVLDRILEDAVDIATQLAAHRLPHYFQNIGDIFQKPANPDSLALEYDPNRIEGLIEVARAQKYEIRSTEEVLASLVPLVQDAVADSIVKNEKIFASMVINEMREGNDL